MHVPEVEFQPVVSQHIRSSVIAVANDQHGEHSNITKHVHAGSYGICHGWTTAWRPMQTYGYDYGAVHTNCMTVFVRRLICLTRQIRAMHVYMMCQAWVSSELHYYVSRIVDDVNLPSCRGCSCSLAVSWMCWCNSCVRCFAAA